MGDSIMSEYKSLLSERTKIVAVASVSNTLGTINPIAEIVPPRMPWEHSCWLTRRKACRICPLMSRNSMSTFFAFSGHKMLGPSGVGILYGKEKLLDAMPPFLGGGSMINEVRLDGFTPAELPAKFEAGTPPIAPAIAMSAAIEYLENIGLGAIHRHEQALTEYAYDQLSQVEGLRILGPAPEYRAGLISFAFERIHAHEFAQVLNDRFGVAVRAGHHCTQPLHKLWASPPAPGRVFIFTIGPRKLIAWWKASPPCKQCLPPRAVDDARNKAPMPKPGDCVPRVPAPMWDPGNAVPGLGNFTTHWLTFFLLRRAIVNAR